jgi:hypothetical protein
VRQLNVSIEVKKGGERKQKCGVRNGRYLLKVWMKERERAERTEVQVRAERLLG